MKKRKISRLAGRMVCLPFLCLPLMGQTTAGHDRPMEKTWTGKAEVRKHGELQLRAAARAWPDSVITFTTTGERMEKYSYACDAAGNLTLSEYCEWMANMWINRTKDVYAYDAAGREILHESYHGEENNRWRGSFKTVHTYDSRGICILQEHYGWPDNTWVKSSEEHYDRKTVDAKVFVNISVSYNEDGSRRDNSISIVNSGLNLGSSTGEEQKMEYNATYDANGNLTLVETTILADGKRVPHERYVLEYSGNNPVSTEMYGYNGTGTGQMQGKATQTYDANGNLTLSESYAWNRYLARWDGVHKNIYTCDAAGNPLSYQSYDWYDSSADWVESWKYTCTYDANGNPLSYERYDWDPLSGGWLARSKDVYTYDANGNQLTGEYYGWDTSSGSWIMTWKESWTYNANGKELSYEYYDRDALSGSWRGGSKAVCEETDEYGDPVLYRYYSWGNSDWEWIAYAVLYSGGNDPSGTEHIGGAEPLAYICGNMLYLQTVTAGRIAVYTLSGAKVYESAVPAGTVTISTERLPKGMLIVRGSSGWTKKMRIKN
jgi:hypothetical protein